MQRQSKRYSSRYIFANWQKKNFKINKSYFVKCIETNFKLSLRKNTFYKNGEIIKIEFVEFNNNNEYDS